jgi:thiamine transport system permease protein
MATLLESPHYLQVLGFTLRQATLSTVLTTALALPGAYIIARFDFPGKSIIEAITTVPFVLPTIVVALAFTTLVGPRGFFNRMLMDLLHLQEPPIQLRHTLTIILIAHIFYNFTLVLRIVGSYWANLDPRVEEAARTLGASPWRAFLKVTLPLLTPAIGAAALLVFTFCFTSFGVILVLGGPRFATLEVAIYRQTVQFLNLPLAATLSLIQILITFGLMVAYTELQKHRSLPLELRSQRSAQRKPRGWKEVLAIIGTLGPGLLLLILPLAALVTRSFTTGSGALSAYVGLLENPRGAAFYVPPIAAVRNSLLFALATVALSLALGLTAAFALAGRSAQQGTRLERFLDPLLMLPLGTSAVTLGLGYIVALDEPPLNLRTSPLLVIFAHALVALPFVVRSVLPALRAIRPQIREAAAILGASPWRILREIDLPIVARPTLVAAAFAFTVSMGEFGATSLIARPERPTMPVAIYRFLSRPGSANYAQALAMSTVLMLICSIAFLLIERFRVGEIGEF